MEEAHQDEAGDRRNRGVEHQRGPNGFEDRLPARELDLCQCVCAHGRDEQVTESSHHRGKHRVEDVP